VRTGRRPGPSPSQLRRDPETGHFAPGTPRYTASVCFHPRDRQPPKPRTPGLRSGTGLDERWPLAIAFPKLDGYRVELPDEPLHADFHAATRWHLDRQTVALWVENRGVVGAAEEVDLDDLRQARAQRIAFAIAKNPCRAREFFAALAASSAMVIPSTGRHL